MSEIDRLFGWVEKRVWRQWVPMGKAELYELPPLVLTLIEEEFLLHPLKSIHYRRFGLSHCGRNEGWNKMHAVNDRAICAQCGHMHQGPIS